MGDAVKQITEELGKEALIVETRYVKQPGFLGSFKPKIVEVIAGIDQTTKQGVMNGQPSMGRRLPVGQTAMTRPAQMPQQGPRMTNAYQQPQQMVTNESMSYYSQQPMAQSQMMQPEMKPVQQTEPQTAVQSNPQPVNQPQPQAPVAKPVVEIEPVKESVVKQEEVVKSVPTYSKFPAKTQVEGLKTMMTPVEESKEDSKMDALEDEMKEIRRLLTNMALQPKGESGSASKELTYEEQFQVVFGDYDFSKKIQQGFKAHLIKEGIPAEEVTLAHLKNFVEQTVERSIKVSTEESTSPIHVFVGPPGVGKTTTIAKIASNEILNHQRKVGLITVDTYRIGAVEQLKTYAELLNAPIEVVYSPDEMMASVAKLQAAGCDMIIVDSIGRSHRDQGNLEDLNKLINPLETDNVYLVLNMSTKYRELLKIMDNFKFMNYRQFVFTKLDESERNENILNICYEKTYPVAFLCTGQEVPRDIERPTKERLMEFVWGGALNE